MSIDRIIFNGLINSKNISLLTNQITKMNQIQQNNKKKPIWLIITSRGGNLSDQYKAYHGIKKSPRPVYTIIDQYAYSAGLIVALSGSKRYMTPGSYGMIHSVCTNKYFYKALLGEQSWEQSKKNEYVIHETEQFNLGILQNNKLINNINRMMIRIIKKETKSKVDNGLLHKMVKNDTYLDPRDCIDYGLVDNLINIDDFNNFSLNDHLITDPV